MRRVGAEFLHTNGQTHRQTEGQTDGRTDQQTDRQTNRHDEANSPFSQFCESD
jgi:hypothetical protein